MRQVSIKQLYGNLSKELQDLPFEVTRNGVIIGTMLGPGGLDNKAENTESAIISLDNESKESDSGLDPVKKAKIGLDKIIKRVNPHTKRIKVETTSDPVWTGGISKAKQVGKKK